MPPRTPNVLQTSLVRQRPHRSRINLSIYQPNTIFSAIINMPSVAIGERQITVTKLAGDPNSVFRGLTCYIGTTPGGRDQGRIRVIAATATQVTVAENQVPWVNGWYLTVCEYLEAWAVFPRIILQNNVPIFYKDYDIVYTDQNLNLDPVVCMGPNIAGFIEPTGSFSVYYSSSGTYDPANFGIPTGYAWTFEGGTPTGSGLRDPGYINYTGAGHFMTSLTVTANDGKQRTGRRFVSVYTRPDQGPAFPIMSWGLRSFEGSRTAGGYGVRMFVRQQEDFAKVADGALVVLWTDDWRGSTPGVFGGNAENRDSTLFVGYIEDDSITLDPVTNVLEFRVNSITEIAQKLATYSASLESKVTPGSWNEYAQLTVDGAVNHFLRWHSTLLDIADFSPTGDTLPIQFADFSRGGVYEAINSIYSTALMANVVADRQGKIWAEIDANLQSTGTVRQNILGSGFGLTRQDWRRQLAIQRTWRPEKSYIELGGVAYTGPGTGTNTPYIAGAPGDVAGYFGSVERNTGMALASQAQLNALVGLVFARDNAVFKDVDIPMAGDYRFLEIAPQSRVLLTVPPSENWRGLDFQSKPFIPQEVRYEYQTEHQQLLMDVKLREETQGPAGTTILIPVEPPYQDNNLPGWDITFPPIMPFPPIFPPIQPQPPTGDVVYLFVNGEPRFYRTRNFTASSPTWEELPLPSDANPNHVFLNLNDPINGAFTMSYGGTSGTVGYMTNNLDSALPTWVQFWGIADSHAACLPVATIDQFHFNDFHQEPALGYFIGICQVQTLGTPERFIYGAPGGWTAVLMSNANFGGFEDSYSNVRYVGGSTILATAKWRIYSSGNLGVSQAGWTQFDAGAGAGDKGAIWSVGGPNIVWADKGHTFGSLPDLRPATWFCPHLWSPLNNTLWQPSHASPIRPITDFNPNYIWVVPNIGPMSMKMPLVWDGAATMYALLQACDITSNNNDMKGNNAFGAKDIGAGTWQIRWRSDLGSLYPIAVFAPDSPRLASFYHQAASSYVAYSLDGGWTWLNKNGNLPTLRAGIGQTMNFYGAPKFAGVFSIY